MVVVVKSGGKKPLEGLRLTWEDNITMVFRKWNWEGGGMD